MSAILTRPRVTTRISLEYIRDPIAIEAIDLDQIVRNLRDGGSDDEPLHWIAREPVTAYDHVVVATEPGLGCVGFLGVQDDATEHEETFFLLRTAFVAERARGRGLIRRMIAMLTLRAIGNEELPSAIVMRTGRAMLFRSLREFADRLPGTVFYPAASDEPTNLRAAYLARRVAHKVGHGIRFSPGTGAFRGGAFAAAGPVLNRLAPEHRIEGLPGGDYGPPDQVLAMLDLRAVGEEDLADMSRAIYRRP
jgi:hypothetical protein